MSSAVGGRFRPERARWTRAQWRRPLLGAVKAPWRTTPYVFGAVVVHAGPEDGYDGEHELGAYGSMCPCGPRVVPARGFDADPS